MKRFLVLPILLLTCAALAQTPGPESNNNSRNDPSVNVPKPTPDGQPATGTQAPATATDKSGAASGVPAQNTSKLAQPTTEILPQGGSEGSADPLLEPKELPRQPLSLIGGRALKIDPIRNRVELEPFGGGKKVKVRFDDRSHIYRDGRETTVMGIHKGDRVYVDTMLMDGHIFAKNLRVLTSTQAAEARGQILQAHPGGNEFTMIDNLTGQSVRFQVTPRTALQQQGETTTTAALKPGTIVDVMFLPGEKGGTARQVLVLAVPGQSFIFSGKVTNLDVSTGTLSIDNQTDDRNYTLHFDPSSVEDREHLSVGRQVTAQATFDGRSYHATALTVMPNTSAQQ